MLLILCKYDACIENNNSNHNSNGNNNEKINK